MTQIQINILKEAFPNADVEHATYSQFWSIGDWTIREAKREGLVTTDVVDGIIQVFLTVKGREFLCSNSK